MIRAAEQSQIVMEDVTDPLEMAQARARRQRLERNWAWFDAHAKEIYKNHRGRCVCVAGAELFVADNPEESLALAKAAHPDDDGRFTRIIPKEKMDRIYAHHGTLVRM